MTKYTLSLSCNAKYLITVYIVLIVIALIQPLLGLLALASYNIYGVFRPAAF